MLLLDSKIECGSLCKNGVSAIMGKTIDNSIEVILIHNP